MGCGALKKIFRAKNLQKNCKRPFSRAIKELLLANSHNPFPPLVCKTNNVAKKFLTASEPEYIPPFIGKHNEGEKLMSLETHVTVKLDLELGNLLKDKSWEERKAAERESNEYKPTEEEKTEIINTWELMEGLDDEETCNVSKETHSNALPSSCGADKSATARISRSKYLKSFDAEDYDAFLARSKRPLWNRNSKRQLYYLGHDHIDGSQENSSSVHLPNIENTDMVDGNSEKDQSPEANSGERRMQVRANLDELGGIMIPTFLDFSAVGSLKEWLHEEGHPYSSPDVSIDGKVTNKRESSVYSDSGDSDSDIGDKQWDYLLFDPELLASLEKDLEQVCEEEQHVLQQINGHLNLLRGRCYVTENEDGLQDSSGTEDNHVQSIFPCNEEGFSIQAPWILEIPREVLAS